MKSLSDHIGANWVKWLLFIVFTVTMGFNTYIVNRVDATEKSQSENYVKKDDYIREIEEVKGSLNRLDNKMDVLLIKNAIDPSKINGEN